MQVFIIDDGRPLNTKSHYRGVYVAMETIRRVRHPRPPPLPSPPPCQARTLQTQSVILGTMLDRSPLEPYP